MDYLRIGCAYRHEFHPAVRGGLGAAGVVVRHVDSLPPVVVDHRELQQRREDEGRAHPHPDVQGLRRVERGGWKVIVVYTQSNNDIKRGR